jgi:SAM-dependent methyltransferase
MSKEWNRQSLMEQSSAFTRSRILLSAAELDIFTKLSKKPVTAESISASEGWDTRGTRILLDALAAMELLTKSTDGVYSVPEPLQRLMISSSEESILPMILHRVRMWRTWSNLTEIVQEGKKPADLASSRSKEDMEAFIGAMHVVGRTMAETVADALDLSHYRRFLDVGGASGTYVIAFLERAPHMTATLFDLPDVADMAEERLTQAGLLNRVTIVPGDYNSDPLPTGHDLALLSAIVHINSLDRNIELYKKIYHSLDPGGTIVIRDHVMEPDRTEPQAGAIFAVNMLVATSGGGTYTFDEIQTGLETAGFEDVKMVRHGTDMDQLVTAVKPA